MQPVLAAFGMLGYFGFMASFVSGIVLIGPLATFWWVGLLFGGIIGGAASKFHEVAAGPVPGMMRSRALLIDVLFFALFMHFTVVQTIPLASFLLGSQNTHVVLRVISYSGGGHRGGCGGFVIGSAPIGARRACDIQYGQPAFDLRNKRARYNFARRRPHLCVSGPATSLAIRPTKVVAAGRQIFAGNSPCGKYSSARW